jgi:septum formation protein
MPTRSLSNEKSDRDRLILASTSPRRRELLAAAGYSFDVIAPTVEEPTTLPPGVSPAAFAEAVSLSKAESVAALVRAGTILAADTVAAIGNTIFGKPADREDAGRILSALYGSTHDVITGVTLLDATTGRRLVQHDITRVTMRRMKAPELASYLDSQDWQGKAGAYGIQDRGDEFVTALEGSFTNVVGLPVELLSRMLEEWRRE